ncbi:putative disease resistance protein RGA4 [Salvia hispanica]|uniref:putative disease resistance protein RGA4 n=1 Tax=Salvia hispanica TaxID=49212 RepID=UPI002009B288|nr:putative disease resistance protein RGA4 [Salvia hispanica]
MADAIISVVVERAAALIEEQIRYEVNSVRGVKKELLELSDKLETIINVLDDAENRGVKDLSVKRWLKRLENTAYEMDDILDEWNYSLLKHNMKLLRWKALLSKRYMRCSFIPSSCLCFEEVYVRRETADKIEHVKATLDQILKDKDDFNFVVSLPTTSHVPTSRREQSTHLIDLKNVHGLDILRKKNDIVNKMMLNDGETQILSIVGTGGLGKTTLAKLVYNDSQVEDCFKLKIWICVSDPFDVVCVAKGIVDSVGTETIPPNTDQLALVLQKLEASVSGKKFLLVLDDVWTEDESKWKDLKISLQCGAAGSKILVTTRNERVAKMMGTPDNDICRPNHLSEEECWSLLRDTSLPGKSEEECVKFEGVGKKIASKCKGLPLAAIVLGRLLRFKDLEGWKHVENSEIWQMEKVEVELFPHLVLSYNELSPTLKRCFSYCAFYPKDHQIHAGTLIEQWMALGYLRSASGNDEVELKGRECLNNLAMRSLFQDVEVSESGEQIEWCKMHDIVHDFALFLRKNDGKGRSCQICDSSMVSHVQEYRSLSWSYYRERGEFRQVCDCLKSLRVLKVEGDYRSPPPPQGMETLIHLRWLEFRRVKLPKDGLKIICRLYFLQTLVLSGCFITEIPREIENLMHLRQLDLSWNQELKDLPDSMCKLVELRTLSIAKCSLKEIPSEIENLVQLRRLDLSGNASLKELPESIYSLVELRSLSLGHCSLKEIRGGIGKLVQLRQLDISLNWEIHELPESICSLVELQVLKIRGTSIIYLPEAIGELSNLRTLELCRLIVGSHYNKLGFLTKLDGLLTGSLVLEIYCSSMSEMVELVEDAGKAQLKMLLQKLKELKICFMCRMNETEQSSSSMWMEVIEALVPHYKLKELIIYGYGGSRLPHWMSSPLNFIKEIHLCHLSEVLSLPAMGKLPLLEKINIWKVEQLKLVGHEFLGIESSSDDDVVAFPKLKDLTFTECQKWEEWEDITEEEEESTAISIMPYLTELTIHGCESLKKLPHRLLHKASSSLRCLNIYHSPELIKTYGDENKGSPNWRSISQYNPQLQLCHEHRFY